jgi:peptide/nickel transport system substrate-binding protein
MLSDFAASDFLTVVRNDNYWGQLAPTRSMTLRFIPEMAARTIMMLNGETQLCFGIRPDDIHHFQASPDFTVFPQINNNPHTLSFNMSDRITGCWNFRMAVLHAINTGDVAMAAAGDWAVGADSYGGTVWGYQTEFRNMNIPAIPFDLNRAREHLRQSVYSGETVTIHTAAVLNIRAAEMIQVQLGNIGIAVNIEAMDAPGLIALLYGPDGNQSQIVLNSSVFSLSALSSFNSFYPSGNQNRAQYNNQDVALMFNQARIESNESRRRDHYMRIQEIVAQEVPYSNIFWRIQGIAAVRGIEGLILPSDTSLTDLRNVYWVLH